MLEALRKKTSGWLGMAIVLILTVPFALFGIDQYLGGGAATYVARVQAPPAWWKTAPHVWPVTKLWTTVDINQQEFRQRFDQLRQQQRQGMGEAFDSQQFESADNKRKVLDQLINERVMQIASDRNGVVVPNTTVRKTIEAMPVFQVGGKFDMAQYQRTLAMAQPPLTAEAFEADIRESLKREALAGRIALSDFVTPSEAGRLVNALTEQRQIKLVDIPAVPDTAPVSDADAKKYYDTHARRYFEPARATFEVVDADPAKMPPPVFTEEELRKRYDADKAKYVAPDQRLASHILVSVPKDAKPDVIAAARAKAEQLSEQARAAGADFGGLAKANSDDTGSKASGGDLGWVAKDGSMVKPFEDALFAMQKGGISTPVRSDFGFHVIQVRDVRAGKVTRFEEARPQIEKELAQSGAEKSINVAMGVLADEAYKNPANFETTAVAQKLPLEKIGPVAQNEAQGVLAEPAVRRVAFSEGLLKSKGVSDPITVKPGHVVMLHVVDTKPEHQRAFAEVREQVIADVRADRADKQTADKADAIIKAVNGGQTLAAVAVAQSLQVQAPGLLQRGQVPTPEVNRAIFAVPRPAAGKETAGKAALPNGGWMVFAVTEVKPGDPAAFPPDAKAGLMSQLAQANGQVSAESYVKALRSKMKVEVVESRL